MDDKKLSVEQKAHDLAVAYAATSISKSGEHFEIEDLYQEYDRAYDEFLRIVKHLSLIHI